MFLSPKMYELAQGCTQPPIPHVLGHHYPRLKLPWHEGDHSPPSIAKVKNEWSYTSTFPSMPSWCWQGRHILPQIALSKVHKTEKITNTLYSGLTEHSWYSDSLWAGQSGIKSQQWWDFLHPHKVALEPTQPPVKWVPGLSPGSKVASMWC